MITSSLDEKTSSVPKQQSTARDRMENKENVTLIWFDPNNELYDDKQYLEVQLRQINDYVIFHTELESCVTFIQEITKEKIVLIASGSSASQIVSHITALDQVECVFIFCLKKDQYEFSYFSKIQKSLVSMMNLNYYVYLLQNISI